MAEAAPAERRSVLDPLGTLAAGLAGLGLASGPFALVRPNRILDGAPRGVFEALPFTFAAPLAALLAAAALVALTRSPSALRLGFGAAALLALAFAVGAAATALTPPGDALARVSPGWGFWLALFGFALMVSDALTRMRVGPLGRVAALGVAAGAVALLLGSGALDGLAIVKEYASRRDAFWAEAVRHVALAFGATAAAVAIGLPLGALCHARPRLAELALGALTVVQTIPSIALFGLLIAPLAYLAANVPGAAAAGLSGVGAAPALVALTLYGLLPVVSSVVTGLALAPRAAVEAARGAGMTERQILRRVEAPLAAPALIAGLRVTLVQTIGLATVAALIGGGGLGVFVFQGVGQTAIDLVLLGAAPIVALALGSAVLLDAAAETLDRR